MMLQFILMTVYFITAGYFLTAIQSYDVNEVQHPHAYFYFSDDRNVMRRVYISESVDKDVVEEVNKADSNIYCLYTRTNLDTEEILVYHDKDSVNKSTFNATKITVFIIHGWTGSRTSDVNTILTKAFLQDSDCNVIVVDWWVIARQSYLTAVAALPAVGRHLGEFIKWLTTLGITYDKVHVVGHSLGAHVAGNAGKETEGKIKRITGLDPAGPLWEESPYRLIKSDGQYVEVIHTNTACLGFWGLCGDADFFPNGGAFMPNCLLSTCSHSKAFYYMAETVKHNTMYAVQCSSMDDVCSNTCKGEQYLMGNSDLTKNRSGIFRLDTDHLLENKLLELVPKSTPVNIMSRRILNISALMEYSCF